MTTSTERAVLAGGCFWGMQDLFRRQPGVVSTRVGYAGGDVPNATYRNHGNHAESIEIIFDPDRISYRKILEFFFQIHDPTTRNQQGNDVGASYRSAIFYIGDEQKRITEDTIADANASGLWPGKVVTEVALAGGFGRPSPSIRITSNDIPRATAVISSGPTGSSPSEKAPPRSKRTWPVRSRSVSYGELAVHRWLSWTGLVIGAYAPQIWHLWTEHCSAEISVRAYALWVLASALFLGHSIIIGDAVFMVTQLVNIVALAIILVLVRRFRNQICAEHARQLHVEGRP